jgi:hypothetical protein
MHLIHHAVRIIEGIFIVGVGVGVVGDEIVSTIVRRIRRRKNRNQA